MPKPRRHNGFDDTHANGRRPSASGYRHPSLDYRPPPLLRRVNAAAVLLASTGLVVLLWAGLWYGVAAYGQAQIKGWVEAQRASGRIAGYAAMELGGTPTQVEIRIQEPHFAGPLSWPGTGMGTGTGAEPKLDWKADQVVVAIRPWAPWRFDMDASGRHTLDVTRLGHFTGTANRLHARLNPGSGWPEALRVNVDGLTLGGTRPAGAQRLTLNFAHDPQARSGGAAITFEAQGTRVTLPVPDWGLGTTLEALDARLRLTGPMRPGPFKARLETWRETGGAVEVDRLKLRLGGVAMAAEGTLALDGNRRPVGSFAAKFEGLFKVLEVLRARGFVRDADAVVATMGLAALSRRPSDGGAPAINLAVRVQDGKVSLGQFEVFTLPEFDLSPAPAAPSPSEPETTTEPRDFKAGPTVY